MQSLELSIKSATTPHGREYRFFAPNVSEDVEAALRRHLVKNRKRWSLLRIQ